MPEGRKIAFFDFDGTLAHCDSLWPFLVAVAGFWRCYFAALRSLAVWVSPPKGKDRRTAVKEVLLKQTLAGRSVEELGGAIERMRTWPRWIGATVVALRDHHAQGHEVVVATGSLDLYVRQMLGDLPVDAVLATEVGVHDGVLDGSMPLGNCVRQIKAERVAAYMKEHGPYVESWAYGNLPHDLPMMELTTHRVIV